MPPVSGAKHSKEAGDDEAEGTIARSLNLVTARSDLVMTLRRHSHPSSRSDICICYSVAHRAAQIRLTALEIEINELGRTALADSNGHDEHENDDRPNYGLIDFPEATLTSACRSNTWSCKKI